MASPANVSAKSSSRICSFALRLVRVGGPDERRWGSAAARCGAGTPRWRSCRPARLCGGRERFRGASRDATSAPLRPSSGSRRCASATSSSAHALRERPRACPCWRGSSWPRGSCGCPPASSCGCRRAGRPSCTRAGGPCRSELARACGRAPSSGWRWSWSSRCRPSPSLRVAACRRGSSSRRSCAPRGGSPRRCSSGCSSALSSAAKRSKKTSLPAVVLK